MSDQALIDRTAAAIADDLLRYGVNDRATHLVRYDKEGSAGASISRRDVMLLVARHLQRMLAERDEPTLFDGGK